MNIVPAKDHKQCGGANGYKTSGDGGGGDDDDGGGPDNTFKRLHLHNNGESPCYY